MLKFILAIKSYVVFLLMLLAATAQAESCKGAIGTYERLICENTKSLTLSIIESRKPPTYYNVSERLAQMSQNDPCSVSGVSSNYQNQENQELRAQNQEFKAKYWELAKQYNHFQKQYDHFRVQYNPLVEQNQELRDRNQQLWTQNQQLWVQNKKLTNQNQTLKKRRKK